MFSNIAPGIGPMVSPWVRGQIVTAASEAVTQTIGLCCEMAPFHGAISFLLQGYFSHLG